LKTVKARIQAVSNTLPISRVSSALRRSENKHDKHLALKEENFARPNSDSLEIKKET
jgi:hypothetical protein